MKWNFGGVEEGYNAALSDMLLSIIGNALCHGRILG